MLQALFSVPALAVVNVRLVPWSWMRVSLVAAAGACAVAIKPSDPLTLEIMAVIPLAALLSSIVGFAFSPICGAMLFPMIGEPVQTMQVLLVCSTANQLVMTWSLRTDIQWRGMLTYFTSGLAGVCLGVWLLLHVNQD